MAFGGPRSFCVRPGVHSARHQDSRNDWTPCRMAWPFVSAGAHAPHSNETPDPTPTRGASHSARRLRSLAFLCSSEDGSRLELWLSLAKRASNSRMRSRRCAMSAVCSATRSRNHLSSSSGFSGEWV